MKDATGHPLVTPTPWDSLRRFTDARIALGRAGHSQPTAAHLAFQLAHAQARDAVHLALDVPALATPLQALGFHTLDLHSAAPDRERYLQRPDWGRRLDAASCERLKALPRPAQVPDLAIVVADGLSALGVQNNTVPLLQHLLPLLQGDASPWRLAPLCLVRQGRVAVGDEVGALLGARCVLVLIGERPGLSSPDSLGLYFSWAPRVGLNDAQRNCISNVRDAGLPPALAAVQLHRLLNEARRLELSGVALKDDDPAATLAHTVYTAI